MKALVVDSPGKLILTDLERPSPKPGDLLVKMRASGVCGTDIEKVHGHGITSKVLGHEVVGEVAALGEGVAGFTVGERVFTHHHAPCLTCDVCLRGEFTLCPEFGRSNIVPCGFAEYYVVPEFNVSRGAVIKLPDSLGYKEASLIEPLACCIRGLAKVRPRSVSRALIYGAGPVGLLHLKLLRNFGVEHVEVVDVSPYRLEFGRRMGAVAVHDATSQRERDALLERSDPEKPDLVILATGSVSAFDDAIGVVARGGTVLLFGAPAKGSTTSVNTAAFFIRGLSLLTSYSATEKETVEATETLSHNPSFSELVTHTFPLTESVNAFQTAQEQKCIKAIVVD